MDININVRIESPEIMAALLALAEALPQRNLGAALPAKEGQETTITIDQVKEKLASLSHAGKAPQAKTLLKKFGANKLSEMAVHNYDAFLKEAETIQ